MLAFFVILLIMAARVFFFNVGLVTGDHYDFIVIGAGPAGCVIVNKLVNRGAKVLLLGSNHVTNVSS